MKEVPWQIYLPKGLLFIIRRATRTRKAKLSECSLNRGDDSFFYLRSNANTKKVELFELALIRDVGNSASNANEESEAFRVLA